MSEILFENVGKGCAEGHNFVKCNLPVDRNDRDRCGQNGDNRLAERLQCVNNGELESGLPFMYSKRNPTIIYTGISLTLSWELF